MATCSPSQRALRIGVLLGDTLVEERLFENPGPISIGQSLRCSLSIPADGMPVEHVLFAVDRGHVFLRVNTQMTGRLAQGTQIKTELRQGPGTDGIWTIPIERGTRGKLTLGNATILFQEVAAPPIAPRPQLPASVRGTFADRIDRRLAIIVAGSLLVHVGIGSWAWLTELVHEPASMPELANYEPPTVEQLDLVVPDIKSLMPTPTDTGEPTRPAVAQPAMPSRQTARPIVPRVRPDQLPDDADPERFAQMLTGNTSGPGGGEEIKKRLPGAELEKQIDEIRENNRNVRVGGNNRTSRDAGVRRGTGPDGPIIEGPTQVAQLEKVEREPRARLDPLPPLGPPLTNPTTLSAQMVLARIQGSYMAGLKRCYVKHGLSVDPSMVAKVTLTFVIDDTGRSTENTAHGANLHVDSCVLEQMGGWRFPVPKDKEGNPTEKPFKVQLALQPSL
jgi:hypothetical protein